MVLVFATNNDNKVKEVRAMLGDAFEIITLKESGIDIDTLEDNAREKSTVIYNMTGKNCFSEDTGLEIDALNGEPGVLSARYAGEQKESADNIGKVLDNLQLQTNRKAQFRTVISLRLGGQEHQFEGICEGEILESATGGKGFGYDPIFKPTGADRSFAQMEMSEKNGYSHRAKAFKKLVAFLKEQQPA
jgi:XTP/dITP diphosphohydrolase